MSGSVCFYCKPTLVGKNIEIAYRKIVHWDVLRKYE